MKTVEVVATNAVDCVCESSRRYRLSIIENVLHVWTWLDPVNEWDYEMPVPPCDMLEIKREVFTRWGVMLS